MPFISICFDPNAKEFVSTRAAREHPHIRESATRAAGGVERVTGHPPRGWVYAHARAVRTRECWRWLRRLHPADGVQSACRSHEQTNEQTNERPNKRTNQQTDEHTKTKEEEGASLSSAAARKLARKRLPRGSRTHSLVAVGRVTTYNVRTLAAKGKNRNGHAERVPAKVPTNLAVASSACRKLE